MQFFDSSSNSRKCYFVGVSWSIFLFFLRPEWNLNTSTWFNTNEPQVQDQSSTLRVRNIESFHVCRISTMLYTDSSKMFYLLAQPKFNIIQLCTQFAQYDSNTVWAFWWLDPKIGTHTPNCHDNGGTNKENYLGYLQKYLVDSIDTIIAQICMSCTVYEQLLSSHTKLMLYAGCERTHTQLRERVSVSGSIFNENG